ncbi:hypothetical protein GGR51DRAFT_233321 [Nemania sp. FL0031]|nr:hypothetical protein GGR51DRAFT_233321 [Nemania sp. FL0031]
MRTLRTKSSECRKGQALKKLGMGMAESLLYLPSHLVDPSPSVSKIGERRFWFNEDVLDVLLVWYGLYCCMYVSVDVRYGPCHAMPCHAHCPRLYFTLLARLNCLTTLHKRSTEQQFHKFVAYLSLDVDGWLVRPRQPPPSPLSTRSYAECLLANTAFFVF